MLDAFTTYESLLNKIEASLDVICVTKVKIFVNGYSNALTFVTLLLIE